MAIIDRVPNDRLSPKVTNENLFISVEEHFFLKKKRKETRKLRRESTSKTGQAFFASLS